MGMFDIVLVEYLVDGIPDAAAIEWQTKAFDCPFMEKYRITADGRLLHEIVHYEDRSDPTAAPGTFASLRGAITPVHEGWRDMEHHGDLSFCGVVDGVLVDLTARFTEGNLVRIGRSSPPRERSDHA